MRPITVHNPLLKLPVVRSNVLSGLSSVIVWVRGLKAVRASIVANWLLRCKDEHPPYAKGMRV